MKIYIDESGNTGDLSLNNKDLSFSQQPVFVLAGVTFHNEGLLLDYIQQLKSKYKINPDKELKSTLLLKKKPSFILELVELLTNSKASFFIEVVDKKYQLITYIVDYFVLPSYYKKEITEAEIVMKQIYAAYLYQFLHDDMYHSYIQLMKEPNNKNIYLYGNTLIEILSKDNNDISRTMIEMIRLTLNDFEDFVKTDHDLAWKSFLPIPDVSKKGYFIWALPHYNSFANLYARLNQFFAGNLGQCIMIHDEQKHFDEILQVAKKHSECSNVSGKIYLPESSNFSFTSSAQLEFKSSKDNLGIQIADVLAGLLCLYQKNIINNVITDNILLHAVDLLICNSNDNLGVGINYVVPQSIDTLLFRLNRIARN